MFSKKRYQVFVSSTYEDLKEERNEVMRALLELDCIPAGMELFPAADEDQWSLIKKVIDESDYYIVIIGGRYGSISEKGISYTQMEYEYALKKQIPIIGFIHSEPKEIPTGKTDQDDDKRKKLLEFKGLVEKKMVKHWTSPKDLGSVVSRSLIQLIKTSPGVGWVKASELPEEDLSKEVLQLRREKDSLEKELKKVRTEEPEQAKNLAKGTEEISLSYQITLYYKKENSAGKKNHVETIRKKFSNTIQLTWDRIFMKIAPNMLKEYYTDAINHDLNDLIVELDKSNFPKKADGYEYSHFSDVKLNDEDFKKILIQFRALGLIEIGDIERERIHDSIFWKLTAFGDNYMTRLLAKQKKN